MRNFINLERRFRDLTQKELEGPELLAMMNDGRFGSTLGWSELLELSRVVLLAEAGSGKTCEMEEQARRLAAADKPAFFVSLERLHNDSLIDALAPEEERSFEAWKAEGRSTAWFFLDAVDELILRAGKLDQALLRLSKAIDGHLERARVIISSRPSDWRPNTDMAMVMRRLPLPKRRLPAPVPPPNQGELFLRTLSRNSNGGAEIIVKTNGDENDDAKGANVRTVILLPMSNQQIEFFAQRSGVADAATLVAEIGRRNAWAFARRPLDLAALITTWKPNTGQLGTRAQQHEANVIAKLKDAPDRPDRDVLADDQARLGAERLALALALSRTRTIKSPEQALETQRAEGVLDPALILRNSWTEAQRQALLRRALFDPATYGRFRFHHRSIQEYLAAQRLKALRDKGMSTKALFRLLFAEPYGERIVIPSMRSIAAWLALWNEPVRQELTRREPEALLSLGDPESLSISARAELLRAFAGAYGHGGWRDLNIPIDEVRRLAHPDLAPTIRELWGSGPTNTDVRELLIEVIWQGAVAECVDLARAAALDTTWDYDDRANAVRALLATGHDEMVREITRGLLDGSTDWPDKGIYSLAADLFPKFITVDELMTLMERTLTSRGTVGDFEWVACQIVETVEPTSNLATELRDKLADLIWGGRNARQEFYRIGGPFEHLTPALATLCTRQLVAPFKVDASLLRACVIASRFGHDVSGTREPVDQLRTILRERPEYRAPAFWAELALMDALVPEGDVSMRLYHAEQDGLIGYPVETDRAWLEATLADEAAAERRPVALLVLLNLWSQRGRDTSEVVPLRGLLKGDQALEATLLRYTATPNRDPKLDQRERDIEQRKKEATVRESQRLEEWSKWRGDLLANPNGAFSSEMELTTIRNFHSWMKKLDHSGRHCNVWNSDAIEQMFGSEVAQRTAAAFQAVWRKNTPALWSARPSEKRGNTPWDWIYGLCGVASEAELPDWTSHLTTGEARLAVAYAAVESNGFAKFVVDLVRAFPKEVDEVLGGELSAELAVGPSHDHLPILATLVDADSSVKRILAPRLVAALNAWPQSHTGATARDRPQHLGYVLRILDETTTGPARMAIARTCAHQYKLGPSSPLASAWLRGLFRFDSEQGAELMAATLSPSDDAATRERAIETFAELFGDRHDVIVFEIDDPARRARALKSLVESAFAFIRQEDDLVHDDVYSPNTRDDAERAREFLLSTLLGTPGPEARDAILELVVKPDFTHFSDHLRLLVRGRAAAEAEFDAYSAEAVNALEARYELPPHDRDTLFDVMNDRLEDLDHDIMHHDFSNRGTLRTITAEVEMQRTLALWLGGKANGAYVVEREGEVADNKRVDIRLLAVHGGHKAVIEVKLADNWALNDFERALRHQLVGQYLRHESCRAGILLLTYNGKKQYWKHPTTRKRLDFPAVMDYLRKKARGIQVEHQHRIRVGVFGLDLRDPHLEPAHR